MSHRLGINSLKKTGSSPLTGDITLSAGTNVTLTQSGNDIEIAASGSGDGTTTYFNDYHTNQSGLTSSGLDALTGSVNGTNTTFTVSDGVYAEGTLQVYLNGVLQVLGDVISETTPASGVFDFVTAPASGSQIYVHYATQDTTSDTVVRTSDLADIATTGSFNDLVDVPSLPEIPATFDDLDDGTTNKAYTATEKTKLSGIASAATANDTDANLKNRANHTGTQALSTIADVTVSAAEVNILVGATLSTTELNYLDGVTGAIQPQLDDKVEESVLTAAGKGFVNHDSTASTARPSGYASIEWHGSVEPTNAVDGDTWIEETA